MVYPLLGKSGAVELLLRVGRVVQDEEFVKPEWDVQSFPTLLRFPADGSGPVKYQGTEEQRDRTNMGAFLRQGAQP